MGIAGISPPGGAPKPGPERVAAIRYTLVDEPETCAAFGETARATLASLNDRALVETRSGDLGECSLLLAHVRDRVAGLDPARLEPRTGIAGLFDSRNKRLKGFRAAYASAATAVTQSASDIGDRAGALARKSTALETLWSETRDAIAELDAHIAAARSWLGNETPPAPAEPVAAVALEAPAEDALPLAEIQDEAIDEAPTHPVEDMAAPEQVEAVADVAEIAAPELLPGTEAFTLAGTDDTPAVEVLTAAAVQVQDATAEIEPEPEPQALSDAELSPEAAAEPEITPELEAASEFEAAPEPMPVASLPHPLETRLVTLEAVRATAMGRLPLLRAAQNADCRTPAALKQICDGVEAWRADWHDALGLAGKRPKKVRPDRVRLSTASSALTDHIQSAGRELTAAQSRRAELDARAAPPQAQIAA